MADFAFLSSSVLLYAGLGVYFWRFLWQGGSAMALAPMWEKLTILVALLFHTISLAHHIIQPDGLKFGVGHALSAISLLTVLVYWLASMRNNLEGLQGFVLPFAAVGVAAPLFLPATHTLPHSELPLFKIHLVIALTAYSLFTIAALHALLMAVAERHLHSRPVSGMLQRLPPLLTMEHLLFRILWGGFVLLSLTLASGMIFSQELFGRSLQLSHKTVFALISWAIYAALLGGRQVYGWRGRMAVRWTLSGFVVLVLAYIGSKFVLEIILHR